MQRALLIEQTTLEEFKAEIKSWINEVLAKNKPEQPVEEELLTEKQAAELLKVARQTLKNWRDKGLIRYTRRGKSVRYCKSEILTKNRKGL